MSDKRLDNIAKQVTSNVQRLKDTLRSTDDEPSMSEVLADNSSRDRDFKDDAEIVSTAIMEQFSPNSVFEVGCGIGLHLKPFLDNDISAKGVDESKVSHENALIPKRKIKIHQLKEPYDPGKQRDLVLCIDLLEYTARSLEDALITTVANAGKTAVVSVPLPRYSSMRYEQEKPKKYWVEKFKEHGMTYDPDATRHLQNRIDAEEAAWVPEQLMVFHQRT